MKLARTTKSAFIREIRIGFFSAITILLFFWALSFLSVQAHAMNSCAGGKSSRDDCVMQGYQAVVQTLDRQKLATACQAVGLVHTGSVVATAPPLNLKDFLLRKRLDEQRYCQDQTKILGLINYGDCNRYADEDENLAKERGDCRSAGEGSAECIRYEADLRLMPLERRISINTVARSQNKAIKNFKKMKEKNKNAAEPQENSLNAQNVNSESQSELDKIRVCIAGVSQIKGRLRCNQFVDESPLLAQWRISCEINPSLPSTLDEKIRVANPDCSSYRQEYLRKSEAERIQINKEYSQHNAKLALDTPLKVVDVRNKATTIAISVSNTVAVPSTVAPAVAVPPVAAKPAMDGASKIPVENAHCLMNQMGYCVQYEHEEKDSAEGLNEEARRLQCYVGVMSKVPSPEQKQACLDLKYVVRSIDPAQAQSGDLNLEVQAQQRLLKILTTKDAPIAPATKPRDITALAPVAPVAQVPEATSVTSEFSPRHITISGCSVSTAGFCERYTHEDDLEAFLRLRCVDGYLHGQANPEGDPVVQAACGLRGFIIDGRSPGMEANSIAKFYQDINMDWHSLVLYRSDLDKELQKYAGNFKGHEAEIRANLQKYLTENPNETSAAPAAHAVTQSPAPAASRAASVAPAAASAAATTPPAISVAPAVAAQAAAAPMAAPAATGALPSSATQSSFAAALAPSALAIPAAPVSPITTVPAALAIPAVPAASASPASPVAVVTNPDKILRYAVSNDPNRTCAPNAIYMRSEKDIYCLRFTDETNLDSGKRLNCSRDHIEKFCREYNEQVLPRILKEKYGIITGSSASVAAPSPSIVPAPGATSTALPAGNANSYTAPLPIGVKPTEAHRKGIGRPWPRMMPGGIWCLNGVNPGTPEEKCTQPFIGPLTSQQISQYQATSPAPSSVQVVSANPAATFHLIASQQPKLKITPAAYTVNDSNIGPFRSPISTTTDPRDVARLIHKFTQQISDKDLRLTDAQIDDLAQTIVDIEAAGGWSAAQSLSRIYAESSFKSVAISEAFARGIAQVQLIPGDTNRLKALEQLMVKYHIADPRDPDMDMETALLNNHSFNMRMANAIYQDCVERHEIKTVVLADACYVMGLGKIPNTSFALKDEDSGRAWQIMAYGEPILGSDGSVLGYLNNVSGSPQAFAYAKKNYLVSEWMEALLRDPNSKAQLADFELNNDQFLARFASI